MKRRLSLAVALIQDPDILILDEPTVGIDPELRQSIWAELYRLKNEGKTILVTTHVMDEAEKCDRLAMVRDGEIITSGSPAELKNQYEITSLEEVFLMAGGKRQ
jgi:ABC-2 type transport system ATP-binding protein